MPIVLLVRHGQASFGSDDYDSLSDLGHRQAELTGRRLAAAGLRRPVAVHGSLRRIRQPCIGTQRKPPPRPSKDGRPHPAFATRFSLMFLAVSVHLQSSIYSLRFIFAQIKNLFSIDGSGRSPRQATPPSQTITLRKVRANSRTVVRYANPALARECCEHLGLGEAVTERPFAIDHLARIQRGGDELEMRRHLDRDDDEIDAGTGEQRLMIVEYIGNPEDAFTNLSVKNSDAITE